MSTSRLWPELRRRLPFLLVLLLIGAFAVYLAASMDSGRLSPDGIENVALSQNLRSAGTFSEDGKTPSYLREPLGIWITAGHMAWLTGIPASATPQELIADPVSREQILWVNLYYLVGLLLAVWWLAWLLTRSHSVAALAITGTWAFSTVRYHSGNLLTESLAALTIVAASASLVWLVQTRRVHAAVLAGVTLGLLALTKAAGFYVALVAIPVLALGLVFLGLSSRREALTLLALMSLSFALTVGPWMVRNYQRFDDFAIAQRGGVVLYTRALKDGMTADEYWGSFYAYSPAALRNAVLEPVFGYRPQDLLPGGRYARLVRYPPGEERAALAGEVERTVTFFGQAWATKVRLEEQMAAAGRPVSEADKILQDRATELILAAPTKHIATTLPFAWRGIWAFRGKTMPVVTLNLLAFGALLLLPVLGAWRRRPEWLAFSLLGLGMFWFHAVFTHFIPRYSEPLVPMAVLSVLVLFHASAVRLRQRRPAWWSRLQWIVPEGRPRGAEDRTAR